MYWLDDIKKKSRIKLILAYQNLMLFMKNNCKIILLFLINNIGL